MRLNSSNLAYPRVHHICSIGFDHAIHHGAFIVFTACRWRHVDLCGNGAIDFEVRMQSPFQLPAAARLSVAKRRHRNARQRFDDAAIHQSQRVLKLLQSRICRNRNQLFTERFNDGLELF